MSAHVTDVGHPETAPQLNEGSSGLAYTAGAVARCPECGTVGPELGEPTVCWSCARKPPIDTVSFRPPTVLPSAAELEAVARAAKKWREAMKANGRPFGSCAEKDAAVALDAALEKVTRRG